MTSEIVNNILKSACNNYNEVRGHTMTSNTHSPRTASMFSSKCDEDYTTKVQWESNNMVEDDPVVMSNNPQLEYATPSSQPHWVSKVSDLPSNVRPQHVNNTQPILNNCSTENRNMFNVQHPYDVNQALDPESWDSNFRTILIHGSMEYLASDISNIKESLGRIQKYILGKTIESNNANNIKDLESISKVAWGLISFLYEAHWDSLYVDNQKTSFRNKVKFKFSPMALNNTNNSKGKNKVNFPYISILPFFIPAKSLKEVNKISKFFKKNHSSNINKKSYAQASFNGSNSNGTNMARETLKIKEAFPSLQNKKIEQIQKIISRVTNPKPHINMTTKGSSHK